jgi:TetR/AcrR family transcriptional regulator
MPKPQVVRRRGRPSEKTGVDQTAILKTVLTIFAKNGFEGTNIKAISRQAGVAGSLLYYHYTNKEGIWKAAMQRLGEELRIEMAAIEKRFGDLDTIHFLKSWMRHFIFFSAKNPEFHQIIAYEMANPSPRADWLIENILGPLQAKFKTQSVQLQQEGIIKYLPLANLNSIVIGAANIYFTQAYQMLKLYGVDVFKEEEMAIHADTVIDIFFNGILIDKSSN